MDTTSHLPQTGMKVRLTLTYNHFQCREVRAAAESAFGPKIKDQFHCTRDTQIDCRPDQFAIFLVERNRLGAQNGWKDLHVKLIDPPAFLAPVVDVTEHVYG